MNKEMVSIMILVSSAILCISILFAIVIYEKNKKYALEKKQSDDDWLLHGFHEMVFSLFYKGEKQEQIAGFDVQEYERICRIIHAKPNIERIVAMRIEGIFIFLVLEAIAFLLSSSIAGTATFLVAGLCSLYLLSILPYKTIQHEANERLFRIKDDLPRFLALLEKALELPIDQAIAITASKFKSPLSEDLLDCIHKVSLGADSWQSTLIDLAHTYNASSFSDLVLEIVNAYEQGINIQPLINRNIYELEQTHMYEVEAHDSRIKTMIFLPVVIMKIVPIMTLICLPMLKDLS